VAQVPLFGRHHDAALREHPRLQGGALLYEAIRRMLSALVYDVIAATRAALAAAAPPMPTPCGRRHARGLQRRARAGSRN
jgi:hypothetical protein